jgi:cation diffusion facilitator family transporter
MTTTDGHGHADGHANGHADGQAGGHGHGTRAIIAAFFANLGIAIAKFVGFLFTSSASMLAESVHSLADTGNQGLLLLGSRRARRQPTPKHPFGYGRERYFWAFVVAVVLFTLGAAFAVIEGIEKIRHPHELESPAWAIGILIVAIVLEAFSFRTAVQEANTMRGDASLATFIRRAKAPEVPVVLLEDTGALLGLVAALTAVIVSTITDNAVWDGYGTLTIGILLGIIAIILCIEMKSLLIGESAAPRSEAAIRDAISAAPAVERLIHLRTEHLGPDELLVGAKVAFEPSLTVPQLADAVNAVETAVRAAVPEARVIYVEPDLFRAASA